MAERSAKQLGLSKADLPNSIIEVIATLNKNGFDAYIVGGGVRDTLLGLSPKDFDAVTDAKPHEIKDIFGKRCRIIGRRFQLAHVYSGRDMIEVATFRAPPNGDAHTTSDGMIVRDNVWGDIDQDFSRRDFSINAMYYDPIKGIVHDFSDALDDINNKVIRLLGHAPLRIEEDPVRLLRALRFKAKLGFDFDKALSKQFHDDNWALLDQVSPHRLYDESQKMFTGGYLVPLLPLLFEYGAIKHLIVYPPKQSTALVKQVAVNTDKRIAMGKSINPAFFYAALLWDNYLYQLAQLRKKNMPFYDAQLKAASKVIDRQRIKTAIPKFAEQFIRDIWLMQPKLANPKVKQISQLAEHARFRAAFDFLLLREQCDDEANPLSESTNGMGEWWQTYQTLSAKQQAQAIEDFSKDSRRSPNKPSRNRRNRNTKQHDVQNVTDSASHHSEPSDEKVSNKANGTRQESKKRSTKSKPKTRQNLRYAKELDQLQKLSLATKTNQKASASKQPRPLFVIDAEKIARQVPNQLELMSANTAETNHTSESIKTVEKRQKSSNVAHSAGDVESSKNNISNKDNVKPLAIASKSSAIPSKRRRRLPTQSMTQAERLKDKGSSDVTHDLMDNAAAPTTNRQGQNTHNKGNVSTYSKEDDNRKSSSSVNNSDNESRTEKDHTATKVGKQSKAQSDKPDTHKKVGSLKGNRVPAQRQRRQPSSDKSISERLRH